MALAYRIGDDNELSCVILNPSTLHKARAGGVLTRLLTRTALELAGAMMFAPSPERARELADLLSRDTLAGNPDPVSYTHLRAHETKANLVCRLLL